MKNFSIIFSIYFFALAIIPCADTDHYIADAKTASTYLQTNDCQNARHSNEYCSPLCMCHCCGEITIVSKSENNLVVQTSMEQISTYTQNSPSEISFSVWQPPKI